MAPEESESGDMDAHHNRAIAGRIASRSEAHVAGLHRLPLDGDLTAERILPRQPRRQIPQLRLNIFPNQPTESEPSFPVPVDFSAYPAVRNRWVIITHKPRRSHRVVNDQKSSGRADLRSSTNASGAA